MDGNPRHLSRSTRNPGRRAVILAGAVTLAAVLPGHTVGLSGGAGPGGSRTTPSVAAGKDNGAVMDAQPEPEPAAHSVLSRPLPPTRNETVAAFTGQRARYWGLEAPGVLTRLSQGTAGIALTVDFCGGPGGSGYDQALIAALHARRIPATLFLNSRWIAANPAVVRELAAEPLFELANHGTDHRPLSTTGNSAYGITGTKTVAEVYDEIMTNDAALTALTGTRPRYFRPGTAFLDDVAANIITSLGITAAGFSINADGGATFPSATVTREAAKAKAGDIIICHGNHPGGGTAQGLLPVLDKLAAAGTPFLPLP